jgi:hypothetical protein
VCIDNAAQWLQVIVSSVLSMSVVIPPSAWHIPVETCFLIWPILTALFKPIPVNLGWLDCSSGVNCIAMRVGLPYAPDFLWSAGHRVLLEVIDIPASVTFWVLMPNWSVEGLMVIHRDYCSMVGSNFATHFQLPVYNPWFLLVLCNSGVLFQVSMKRMIWGFLVDAEGAVVRGVEKFWADEPSPAI